MKTDITWHDHGLTFTVMSNSEHGDHVCREILETVGTLRLPLAMRDSTLSQIRQAGYVVRKARKGQRADKFTKADEALLGKLLN